MKAFYVSLRRKRRWRQVYDKERRPTWLEEGPRREVVAAREEGWLPSDASVIDLGCGLGYTSAWLAGLGHQVVGIDRSANALKQARAMHSEPTLTFRRANLARPLRGLPTFDVVLDLLFLHQLPQNEHKAYADNVRRVSAPGTRLLFVQRLLHPRTGERFTPDEKAASIGELLGPAFQLERVERTDMQASRITDRVWKGVELRFRRTGERA